MFGVLIVQGNSFRVLFVVFVMSVLEEVRSVFGGLPQPFRALSRDPELLRRKWENFRLLLEDRALSREVKQLIAYEVVLAHGCPACSDAWRRFLSLVGIPEERIVEVETSLRRSSFDEKTKNLLIFTRHAAEQARSGAVSETLIRATLQLGVSQEELIEAAASISAANELVGLIHLLNLHVLDL